MTSAAFDTLKFARTLRDKGKFSSEQAEGLVDAMADALQGDIATKIDLLVVKSDLRETELRLKAEIEATKLGLETKIESTKADIIKWMFGTIGFQTVIILGTVVAFARLFSK